MILAASFTSARPSYFHLDAFRAFQAFSLRARLTTSRGADGGRRGADGRAAPGAPPGGPGGAAAMDAARAPAAGPGRAVGSGPRGGKRAADPDRGQHDRADP